MPFPSSNIDFPLVRADPTVLQARNLRTQLNALGYTCPLTELPSLERYIKDGLGKVADGAARTNWLHTLMNIQCFYPKSIKSKSVTHVSIMGITLTPKEVPPLGVLGDKPWPPGGHRNCARDWRGLATAQGRIAARRRGRSA